MNARLVAVALTGAVALLCAALIVLTLAAATLGGIVGGGGCGGDGGPGGGAAQIGPRTWSGEQTANAQTITGVVIGRLLPRRAAVIAVTTAIVESGLRNIAYGDRDSLGLFQQRPSQGWGAPASILNPAATTGSFLNHLVAIPGWARLALGRAEQAVQHSGVPDAYAPQEPAAEALVTRFWTGPDNPIPGPVGPGTPDIQLAAFGRLGCPDQGRSNVPLPPGRMSRTMPPSYQPPADQTVRAAVSFAVAQLGKPYVWGATGPTAFDCSGLVQAAWASAGVPISRTTASQVHDGAPVPGLDQAAPGDLLFIPGAGGNAAHPGHVGIYAGHGLVIDAYDSGHGVVVERLARWAPQVVAIRRIHPSSPPAASSPLTTLAEGAR